MPVQQKNKKRILFFGLAWFAGCFGNQAWANTRAVSDESFRTPAVLFGSAYSVKLALKRDIVEYMVPVWIKPSQAVSTLDKAQLKELGWIFSDTTADEVSLSGELIDHHVFQNAKSDWAYPPDYPKVCCYGVIGADILQHFELKFDPQDPRHLEWRRIIAHDEKISQKFIQSLSSLFEIGREQAIFQGKSINFATTPFRLNLLRSEIEFLEPRVIEAAKKLKVLDQPIFSFYITTEDREVMIRSILPAITKKATRIGIKKGHRITQINFVSTDKLNRFEISDWLQGKKKSKIEITVEFSPRTLRKDAVKKYFDFDFETLEFSEDPTAPVRL